ncbi:hypothetical protein EI94DRAFT_1703086 [Lactarius quietus]|nr:hypothetical protein EI94DRAFT_1703086 [Lactarius quietus]
MVHLYIGLEALSILPPMPNLEDTNTIKWLQLLNQFSSIKMLFGSNIFSRHVSSALKHIAGVAAIAERLPELNMLFLEGQPEESIDQFISVHRDSDRSVAFVNTRKEFEERMESYQ